MLAAHTTSKVPATQLRGTGEVTLTAAWISRLAVVCGAITLALPLIGAVRARNTPRGRSSGSKTLLLRWPLVLAFALGSITAGVLLWKPIPTTTDPLHKSVLSVAGAVLYFPGISLYLWGFLTLGSMFGVASSMAAELYQGHRLLDSGPYRLVRHPMYLGVILAAFGALLIFRTWAMLLFAPLSLGVVRRARREESLLASEFGAEWVAYSERVPAWFPRIRAKRQGSR